MRLPRILDRDTRQEVFHTLGSNRKRTIATAFGIFWGIFILTILLSLGAGLNNSMRREFGGVSANSGVFMVSQTTLPYQGLNKGRMWWLSMEDLAVLRTRVPHLSHLAPMVQMASRWGGEENTFYAQKKCAATLTGITAEYYRIAPQKLLFGRLLSEQDSKEQRNVCVIGDQVAAALFTSAAQAIGKVIKSSGYYYTVVGVATDVSSSVNINGAVQESIYIPAEVALARNSTQNAQNQIYSFAFSVEDDAVVKEAYEEMKAYLYPLNTINPQDQGASFLFDISDMFKLFGVILTSINALIFIVGAGTLISGVVGVSNIMLVTVRERTREIGVRRAIGARPRDIIRQILTESFFLTFISGLLGLMLGTGIMALVNTALEQPGMEESVPFLYKPVMSLGTAVLTLVVITAAGLLAGALPANRAVQVKAIEAIREE